VSDFADLLETLTINHRITLYLLDAIDEEALEGKPVGMRGRSVKVMFAHIHNVRMMWLQQINAELAKPIDKIPTHTRKDILSLTKPDLTIALQQSGDALHKAIETRLQSGKIDILKPSPTAFIGYLISHESYHRGEICMTLTQAGHPLDDDVLQGMWVWDKR
jgi:uncharacterized damage-inducible protein DinB